MSERYFRGRVEGKRTTWIIEVRGKVVSTRIVPLFRAKGRVEIASDTSAAEAMAKKMIAEKLRDGFVEVAEAEEGEPEKVDLRKTRLAPLAGSPPDLPRLRAHFAVLAKTPACRKVLDSILERVVEAEVVRDGTLKLRFPKPVPPLLCAPPKEKIAKVPGELAAILAVHSELRYGESDDTSCVILHDGFDGNFHALGRDAMNERREGFPYSESLCVPLDLGLQKYVIYHPHGGELNVLDHDGGLTALKLKYGIGGVYLRELRDAIESDL